MAFSASAEELFSESAAYDYLIGEMDEKFSSNLAHHFQYDDDKEMLTVYMVAMEDSKDLFLKKAELMKDSWSENLDSLKDVSASLDEIVDMALETGDYGSTDGHSRIVIVDRLNSSDDYDEDDIWTILVDGELKYDFLMLTDTDALNEFTGSSDSDRDIFGGDASGNDYSVNSSSDATLSGSASSSGSGMVSSSGVTGGEKNALESAHTYLSFMAFSYSGLIKQLEYEGYSNSEAVYAADHCGADWNEQAADQAVNYLKYSSFSYSGLIEQLEFEGFTHSQAVYGVDRCEADWNEQALKMAESYLEYTSLSYNELVDQLVYEGFTQEQAEYGAGKAN